MGTASAKPDADSIAYAEEDKLGPFGGRAPALHDPGELRARLLGEFETAVAAARAAAGSVDQAGPTEAVHATRKALRRARSALSMLGEALPKSERRAVRAAIQEARRSLSTVRDHAVAPETLGGLTLDDADRATARRVLDNAAAAIPAVPEIKQLLADAAARAGAQAAALAAAVPAEVSWDVIAGGVAEVYGDARRARRLAKRSRSWFHTWRRRSKELVYQLDFIAGLAGARTRAIRAELEAITDALGPAVDLVMLRDFVATHAAGVPDDDTERLRDELDRQLEELVKATRREARDAFRQKPRKFVRRLAKAVKRDLTPADENGHGADADAE